MAVTSIGGVTVFSEFCSADILIGVTNATFIGVYSALT